MKRFCIIVLFFTTVICHAQRHNNVIELSKENILQYNPQAFFDEASETDNTYYISNKSLQSIPFASSVNAFTVIAGKKMASDNYNNVLYVARGGGSFGGSGNDIRVSYSSDLGSTWNVVNFQHTSPSVFRYPGATFFRPQGTEDVYVVSTGPYHNGAWAGNYIASAKTNGNDINIQLLPFPNNETIEFFHLNEGIAAFPNGKLFVVGAKYKSASEIGDYSIFRFQWNVADKKFELDATTIIKPDFIPDMPNIQPFDIAFNDDGSIGYFWTNGQTDINSPNKSTQPLVWKTTNGGDTWTQMPVFNYGNINEIKTNLLPTLQNQNIVRPLFNYGYTNSQKRIPGVVDTNGNLHLIATIQSGASFHSDSLNYIYPIEPVKLFHIYTTTGGWNATYIDTLQTSVQHVGTGESGQLGDISLDHRIHIAKSKTGDKVFAIWTDTDNLEGSVDVNIIPDLKAWGIDITNGHKTVVRNFTQGTQIDGSIIYMNASDKVFLQNDTYHIPVSYIEITNDADPDDSPIIHRYIKNVNFTSSDFATNPSVEKFQNPQFILSQNYPNPANDITYIDITLQQSMSLILEIHDIYGKTVYAKDLGQINMGRSTHALETNKLLPGIYLYSLKGNNFQVTKKMTVLQK